MRKCLWKFLVQYRHIISTQYIALLLILVLVLLIMEKIPTPCLALWDPLFAPEIPFQTHPCISSKKNWSKHWTDEFTFLFIFFSLENKPSCDDALSFNFSGLFNTYSPSLAPLVSFLLPKILFHCFHLKVRDPPNSFAFLLRKEI